MFTQHSAKATIDETGIKRALELYAKDKGMPFDIEVTKFWYKKGSIRFAYDVKPKLLATVATCSVCRSHKACAVVDSKYVCDECSQKSKGTDK